MSLLGSIVFLTLGLLCHGGKIPETWKRCPLGDGFADCMKEATETAIHSMAKDGLSSFGVLPLDPMHFDRLLIDQSTGPVAIKLEFKNIGVTGMKDVVVTKASGDWKKLDIVAMIPVPLSLTGEYTIEGKVLTLPIVGSGHCNLTFHDFKWDPISFKFKEETKKGKQHIVIDEITLNPTTTLLEMEFQNLFNGDKMLGPQMNLFLNENWDEIFGELKPVVSKAFGAAYKDVGNRILSKLSTDEIYS